MRLNQNEGIPPTFTQVNPFQVGLKGNQQETRISEGFLVRRFLGPMFPIPWKALAAAIREHGARKLIADEICKSAKSFMTAARQISIWVSSNDSQDRIHPQWWFMWGISPQPPQVSG